MIEPSSQEMAAKKKAIRAASLARRDALSTDDHQTFSNKIAESCLSLLPQVRQAPHSQNVVSIFWPIRSEVDTTDLMKSVQAAGHKVVLPVVVDKTTIVFRQWETDVALEPAGFGTMGPVESAPELHPDILLMPLAAYDVTGGRIGYGAGYYDRALAKLIALGRKPRRFGIAFSCQAVDHVPQNAHDIALEKIVTEAGVLTVS